MPRRPSPNSRQVRAVRLLAHGLTLRPFTARRERGSAFHGTTPEVTPSETPFPTSRSSPLDHLDMKAPGTLPYHQRPPRGHTAATRRVTRTTRLGGPSTHRRASLTAHLAHGPRTQPEEVDQTRMRVTTRRLTRSTCHTALWLRQEPASTVLNLSPVYRRTRPR